MDFVEVRGSTVEVAVEAGLAELGLERDEAAITVIEEPAKGFLGLGSKTALVRISPKPVPKKKRSRSRGKGRSGSGEQRPSAKSSSGQGGQSRGGGDGRGGRGGGGGSRNQSQRKSGGSREGSRDGSAGGRSGRNRQEQGGRNRQSSSRSEEPVDVAEQAEVAQSFLEGLLESFGLEGTVETRTEDDIIFATVTGQQTEALVGPKAAILEAINELLRTIIQRKTHRRARLRLDIGGYNERRRAALKIYTERLAAQVKEEGGELMLEPMNPAERKVVHDAVAEIKGVRSFSEGEEPHRSVVIALDDSVEDDEDDAADDSGSDDYPTQKDPTKKDPTKKAASSNSDEEDDESSSQEESSDDVDGDPAAETADAESDGSDEGDDADDSESGASDEPVGGLRG
ncbi:MAG: hypothetical protein HKO10_10540 [Acidimicrobiia bacterium]|nr:hypothetical protein [Acidimicrobiia bacterium]